MNYYISDLHFNSTNKYENRTLEHDKLIKENWNKVITNADTVYLLGDIGRAGNNKDIEYICSIISTLKSKDKILVTGNHDKTLIKDARFRQLFTEICDYKEIIDNFNGMNHKLVLSHYPIYTWNGAYKGWIHLYGHTHSNFDDVCYQESLEKLRNKVVEKNLEEGNNLQLPYAYNVGCMNWNYKPITLKEILQK